MLKYLFVLCLALALHAPAAAQMKQGTSLPALAQSLGVGEWGELITADSAAVLTNPGGNSGVITVYADVMARVDNYAYFIGSDHGALARFVRLDLATGAWTQLPNAPWMPTPASYNNGMLHGYHHIAGGNGVLYARKQGTLARYTIATGVWDALPNLPNWQPYSYDALEYFPELGGVVWATGYGDIWLWVEAESKWRQLATGMPKGSTWTTSAYSPAQRAVYVFAGGQLTRINASGIVDRMRPPPVAVYDGSGFVGSAFADPQNGRIVVASATKHDLYEYDTSSDTWRRFLASPGAPPLANAGVVGFAAVDLGVIVYTACRSRSVPCKTFAYRHDGSGKPDTSPPCITLKAPKETSGRLHFSATALDNVGVTEVQWTVDGQPWGGPKTAEPYEMDWNSAWFSDGKHTIIATARDFAGNTSESNFEIITSNPVSAAAGPLTYDERCARPGVIRCYGFDDVVDLTTGHPRTLTSPPDSTSSRIYAPSGAAKCAGGKCWALDPDVKTSGASSLRFEIPGLSGADVSGSFRLNFSDDLSQQIGEGEEVYVQWRQRWTPGMLRVFPASGGGSTTWKLAILGAGDRPGGPIAYSCTPEEMVLMENAHYFGPGFYHSCGTWTSMEYWPKGAPNILLQHVAAPYCYYPKDPTAGCFRFVADEWMTFKMQVRVVGFGAVLGNRVRVWAAREGQPSVQIFDSFNSHPKGFPIRRSGPLSKYGKVWLTPYMTNKDSTEAHETQYTWYDDLIISREDIADPK